MVPEPTLVTPLPAAPTSLKAKLKKVFLRLGLYLGFFILKTLIATYRYRYANPEWRNLAKSYHPKGSLTIAIWHEQILSCFPGDDAREFVGLVSASKDGDIAAWFSEKLGMTIVRGSSSRNGKEALALIHQHISEGFKSALTVDGPRGPRHIVQPGVIKISKVNQNAILPMIAVPQWVRRFNSWDRFGFPLPFTKIVVRYGRPFKVPADAEGEEFKKYQLLLAEELEKTNLLAQQDFKNWDQLYTR